MILLSIRIARKVVLRLRGGAPVLTAFAVASIAAANPILTLAPPECAPGTLQQYIDLGGAGCVLGDKVFAHFGYVTTTQVPNPTTNQIMVTPIATALNPGFSFSAGPPGWSNDIFDILFEVIVQPTGNSIEDASLVLDADRLSYVGTPAIYPFINIAENLCLQGFVAGGACNGTKLGLFARDATSQGTGNRFRDQKQFKPVTFIDNDTNVVVSGGTNGTAELLKFTEQFSESPEPFSILLVATGVGILLLLRRASSRRSL